MPYHPEIISNMTAEQKKLISEWMLAWAADDNSTKDRVNARLKSTGIWAYEAGSGMPTVEPWYNGPIKPGMKFIWNPDSRTPQPCRITRITAGDVEPMVWSVAVFTLPANVNLDEKEVYNEESHFRSMAVPA